jgi:hypothetical protein
MEEIKLESVYDAPQSLACMPHTYSESLILPTEAFGMRNGLLSPSLPKPRQNAEAIVKTYELFIYGDIHHIRSSFRKNVLAIATS